MFQGTGSTQHLLRFMKNRLHGVAVTKHGIRPFMNDGRKGSLTEYGTISFLSAKHQCLQTAHRGGMYLQCMRKIKISRNGGIAESHKGSALCVGAHGAGTTLNVIVFQKCMRSEIIAVRGRSIGDWYNSPHEQRIELIGQKTSSLTSVAKDNMLLIVYETT